MNNKSIYYEQDKQTLKEYMRNHHHSVNSKTKIIYENNKQRLQEQAQN